MAVVRNISASDGMSALATFASSSSVVVMGVASRGSSDRPSFSPRLWPAKVTARSLDEQRITRNRLKMNACIAPSG